MTEKANMQALLQGLDAWLEAHQEEFFADVASLVAIPSICEEGEGGYPYGSACAEALRQMSRLADKYGFAWKIHDWHAISIRYGTGEEQLGIWGHLDVVPVDEGWIYEPFQCKKVKNYLLGRGTQDNKGPDIGSLYLLRYLKENDIVPPFEIRLIYGCQEESGMKDVVEYLKLEPAPTCSFVPDCAFPVCYGEKGFLELKLTSAPLSGAVEALEGGQAVNAIPGKAAAVICGETVTAEGVPGHSAYPDNCVNALCRLGEECLRRDGLSETDRNCFRFLSVAGSDGYGAALGVECSDADSGRMTCAPTLLSKKDGRMEVTMNLRYPITAQSAKIVADVAEAVEQYGLTVEVTRDSAPNHEDPDAPWLQFLTRVFADVTGHEQKPYVMSGGTYARKVPNAVGFGPGLPKDLTVLGLPDGHGECHQPDESQCIDTLFMAWKIYMCTVLRLIETGLPGKAKTSEEKSK